VFGEPETSWCPQRGRAGLPSGRQVGGGALFGALRFPRCPPFTTARGSSVGVNLGGGTPVAGAFAPPPTIGFDEHRRQQPLIALTRADHNDLPASARTGTVGTVSETVGWGLA
jgi:hypothetical protein